MVVHFINAYPSYKIDEVLNMSSQLFFIFFSKIENINAIRRIEYIEAHLLAKALQYAEKQKRKKVEAEYDQIKRLTQGR